MYIWHTAWYRYTFLCDWNLFDLGDAVIQLTKFDLHCMEKNQTNYLKVYFGSLFIVHARRQALDVQQWGRGEGGMGELEPYI